MADKLPFHDLPEVALPVTARAPRQMPLVPESDWTVVDHVCKACMGRLVGRAGEAGRFYRCTNCGASSPPGEPPVMSAPPPSARRHPSICAWRPRRRHPLHGQQLPRAGQHGRSRGAPAMTLWTEARQVWI
jgi:hypothetical protein